MPVRRPPATDLSSDTQKSLEKRQATARRYTPNEKRIGYAWNNFSGTPARAEVVQKLDEVFDSKCAYCEILVPKDIEHFFPKSKFPDRMFRWDNFLRACKNCNTEKLDTFTPLLLDPCSDEPTKFFTWDLESGMPLPDLDPKRRRRAKKTVTMFHLDNQQLCDERAARARYFQFLLLQCLEKKPTPPDARTWLLDELKPTRPWRSVLRQIVRDPTFAKVVARVKNAVPAAAPFLTQLAA